jgi:putative transposase
VQGDEHLWTVLRDVERHAVGAGRVARAEDWRRHAVGAGRVARAEDWRWSGLWARNHGDDAIQAMLSPWPVERPVDWTDRVNAPLSAKELARLRVSVERGRPFGEEEWVKQTASELSLGHTVRPEGRPPQAEKLAASLFRSRCSSKAPANDSHCNH